MREETLVIGDSWASAQEADTKKVAGWPEYLGIPADMRQGVNGSTAAQWASGHRGWLFKAMNTNADNIIISLMGNDGRAAMADGKVTAVEAFNALKNMRRVVATLQRKNTVVLLYTDPSGGKDHNMANAVQMLNAAIRMACYNILVTFADTSEWLKPEHFITGDIHPTKSGHQVIAQYMKELIYL